MDRLTEPIRGWFSRFSSVTQFLIVACLVVYGVQLLLGFVGGTWFDKLFALRAEGIRHGFIWQPVTYLFLHGGLLHILFNLLILWFIGREVEFFIGAKPFVRLYFLGGIAGAALWLAFNWNAPQPVLGASGAVLACVIAFATLFPDRQLTILLFFVIPVPVKAKYLAFFLVALDVVPLLEHAPSGVAHLAHLGGAAFGYVYIKHLGYGPAPVWTRWLAKLTPRRRPSARPAEQTRGTMSPEDFVREKVDPILDKISRDGMQSLTPAERKILDQARAVMEKRSR